MPTYEYRCAAGHEFEQFQRMSEPPLGECPQCGAPAERLLSAGGGLLFKGSGFYITDYRSDSYRKAAAADSGEAKPAAEKSAAEPAKEGSAARPETGGSGPSSSRSSGTSSGKPSGTSTSKSSGKSSGSGTE
jgi:putative FmdB family regulatory protein